MTFDDWKKTKEYGEVLEIIRGGTPHDCEIALRLVYETGAAEGIDRVDARLATALATR